MNSNLILKSDILDIIFEKRNKTYGAYPLRKFYPNRLKLALGFMFFIAVAFSAFTLLPERTNRAINRIYDKIETKLTEVYIVPAEPPKPPKSPESQMKNTSSVIPVDQKLFTNNIKVVDNTVKTQKINTILSSDNIGKENIENLNPGPLLIVPEKNETGNSGTEQPETKIDKKSPVEIDMVDVPPSYPGGMDPLRKFLQKHLQTPDELENDETVNVRIRFVVGYDGKLQSFVTVLDGGDAYNKEVVRVLKKMPDWIPGKSKGENVSVYFTIPVKFVRTD